MKNYNALGIIDLVISNNLDSTLQAILNHIHASACNYKVDLIGWIINPQHPSINQLKKNLYLLLKELFTLVTHGLRKSKFLFDKWYIPSLIMIFFKWNIKIG